jgi:hypothetical protein
MVPTKHVFHRASSQGPLRVRGDKSLRMAQSYSYESDEVRYMHTSCCIRVLREYSSTDTKCWEQPEV